MNRRYLKNLETLKRISPWNLTDIEEHYNSSNLIDAFYEKSWPTNIIFKGKYIHSRISPEKETEQLLKGIAGTDGVLFLFLGLGTGSHLKEFMRKYGKNINKSQIIVIERCVECFIRLMENEDISFLTGTKLFIGKAEERLKEFFSSINPANLKGYRIIALKGAVSIYRDYYNRIEHIFKEEIGGKLTDILTHLAFEVLWLKNIIENVSELTKSWPLNLLKGMGENSTCIVIGAGPSLLDQLKTIRELSYRTTLISVDTALPALLKAGIIPDIIVTLDAQYNSIHDFIYYFINSNNEIISKKPILVYDLIAYPGIVKNFHGLKIFTSSLNFIETGDGKKLPVDNPLISYIKERLIRFDSLLCGGSVLTNALELALYMDFRYILLVGADLSYTDYKTHINSSPLYFKNLLKTGRLYTLQSGNISAISNRKLIYTEGIKEKRVITDYVLQSYKKWIEDRDTYRGRVINCTENGVILKNMPVIPLNQINGSYSKSKKQQLELNIPVYKGVSLDKIIGFLKPVHESIKKILDSPNELYQALNNNISNYKFLENILAMTEIIYKNKKEALEGYLYNLLNFIKNRIERVMNRVNGIYKEQIKKSGD